MFRIGPAGEVLREIDVLGAQPTNICFGGPDLKTAWVPSSGFMKLLKMDWPRPGAKLNYGVNKVRFPHPVRVGSRIRSRVTMGEVTDLPAGKQLTVHHTLEIEGQAKPACVAETVVLLLP